MLMPPEAEPVMPASTLTATASEISGFSPPMPSTPLRTSSKAGSAATTAPKPTSDAVLKIGSTEALAPSSSERVSAPSRLQWVAISTTMASVSARMIDHTPSTDGRPTAPKRGSARKAVSQDGISQVEKTKLATITTRIGSTASGSDGSAGRASASGPPISARS